MSSPQIRYPTTSPTSALGGNNNNNSEYTPLPTDFAPGPNDIVCGRGRGYYNCQGNVQFRATVKQFVEYYLKQPNKSSKTAVLEEIVQYCKRHDAAKFVKQLSGQGWMELSDLSAREKVGNAMREAISARNVQLQQQQAHQNAFAQQQAALSQQQQLQQPARPELTTQRSARQQPTWQRTTVRNPQAPQEQHAAGYALGRHPGMPAPQPMADSTLSTGSATASGRHEIFGKKIAFLSDSQVQYDGGRQNSLFMKTSGTGVAPPQHLLPMNMSLTSSAVMPRRHSGSHAETVQHVQQQQQRPPLRRSSSERSSLGMGLSHSIQMASTSGNGNVKSSGLSSFNQSVVMNFDSLTLPQGGSSEFILAGSMNSALSSSNATDSILSVMTTDSSSNNYIGTATTTV